LGCIFEISGRNRQIVGFKQEGRLGTELPESRERPAFTDQKTMCRAAAEDPVSTGKKGWQRRIRAKKVSEWEGACLDSL